MALLDWFVHHKRFGRFKQLFDRPAAEPIPLESFPRQVHLYWDSGIETAPELVKACVQSWQDHNPGWTFNIWDGDSANRIVDRAQFPANLKTTPYSDILRTFLLDKIGGVWVDATVFCTRPLDDWLPYLMTHCDFFAFRRPGPDREIASWFLASRPGRPIIRQLRAAVMDYWRRQETATRVYHWYHYIFEYLVRTSPGFRREWRKTPSLSGLGMLGLQNHLADDGRPSPSELMLFQSLPMHKLSHKRPQNLVRLDEILGSCDRGLGKRG